MIALLWYGVLTAMVLTMGSMGLTLIYGLLHFPNLAHADYLIFGAYMYYVGLAMLNLDIFSASVFAIFTSIALGFTCHKLLFSSKRGAATLTIFAFGLSFILRESIRLFFGSDIKKFPVQITAPMDFGVVKITMNQLYIVALTLISVLFLHVILKYTRTGKAMRALSDNPDLAEISGVKVKSLINQLWILVMAYAAMGGLCVGIECGFLYPDMGPPLAIYLYAAIVVGGLGNPYGALLGSLIVGLSMELSTLFIPPQYKVAVAFTILLIFLFVRPQGIMGVKRRY